MKKYLSSALVTTLFFILAIPYAQGAPAEQGPWCGVTGTVESVEYKEQESSFLGMSQTSHYYVVSFADESVEAPALEAVDAYAERLGWSREELLEKRNLNLDVDPSVCTNAYGAQGVYHSDTYIYSDNLSGNTLEEGTQVTGLIQHGGDERLAGLFLLSAVTTNGDVDSDSANITEATAENGTESETESEEEVRNQEKQSLQLRLINLLNRMLSLLSL